MVSISAASSVTEVIHSGLDYLPNLDLETPSPNQQLLPLTSRVNEDDHLEIGGCDVSALAKQFGTPLYILDETTLRIACRQYREAFARYYPGESLVLYASKAWNCLAICAIAASEGLGVDVVSGGELYTAHQAGVSANTLYLHGNNKDHDEMQLAIDLGATLIVDNWLELQTLTQLASANRPIRIMVRVTPGIECHTHDYIRTGHLDSKFGFDPDQIDDVFNLISQYPDLQFVGLHAHIGSQIFELQPHADLATVMVKWLVKAREYGLSAEELDIGGGLGIRYTEMDDPPSIDAWVSQVCNAVIAACEASNSPLPKLLAEPGRSLIGSACVTAYTVGSQKVIPGVKKTYLSVDGGMSDNPRPITYESLYRAVVANSMSAEFTNQVAIAGKHCESGDIIIKQAHLPATQVGDTLVVMGTGAYNYSMASNYNRVPRPAAVLVCEGEASLILQRETYQDLTRHDRLPTRLVMAGQSADQSYSLPRHH
jgi:diaminopimelate decarboxylase